jgi:hypothetical protein
MRERMIAPAVLVDPDNSHEVWRDGQFGNGRLSLGADEGGRHVWLETNGDPVADRGGMLAALEGEGLDPAAAEALLDVATGG